MSKLAMKLFENKEECCGCTACYSVCPTSAISMQQDEEGAYYPVIEQSRCIGCRKCERVCSFKKALKTQNASSAAPKVYAARIKDEKELTASSSGGMFTALSDLFLSSGNAVACSVYDTVQYEVRYVLIGSVSERDQARGSKYMKSSLKNIFSEAQQWLEKNPQKKLLFVGMGCEVDGFRSFAEAKKLRDRVVLRISFVTEAPVSLFGSGTPNTFRRKTAKRFSRFISRIKESTGTIPLRWRRLRIRRKYRSSSMSSCLIPPVPTDRPVINVRTRQYTAAVISPSGTFGASRR